jgi:hypothetical protein
MAEDARLKPASADRYLEAYRRLEGVLRERFRTESSIAERGVRDPDMIELITVAEEESWIQPQAARFLHACRRSRNAYSHVSFLDYTGPAAIPPVEVVERLEQITSWLEKPPSAKSVTNVAKTCDPKSAVGSVMKLMHDEDFSQIPFQNEVGDWELITHLTISRWVAAETGSESDCLLDLQATVSDVVNLSGLKCRPRVRQTGTLVTTLIEDLHQAMQIPDNDEGGYPTVLVLTGDSKVRIFTPDDLPKAYSITGR